MNSSYILWAILPRRQIAPFPWWEQSLSHQASNIFWDSLTTLQTFIQVSMKLLWDSETLSTDTHFPCSYKYGISCTKTWNKRIKNYSKVRSPGPTLILVGFLYNLIPGLYYCRNRFWPPWAKIFNRSSILKMKVIDIGKVWPYFSQ